MKYYDRNTRISHDNHINKPEKKHYIQLTGREKRREDKKRMLKFKSKLINRLNQDWWECLLPETQSRIIKEYIHIRDLAMYKRQTPDWKNWISMVEKDYKADTALLREKRIEKILQ